MRARVGGTKRRRVISQLLRLGFSLGLLAVLFRSLHLGTDDLLQRPLHWGWLVAAAVVLLAQAGLAALRWTLIVRGLGLSATRNDAFSLTFIGLFFNQVLPSSVGGDTVRVWRLRALGNPGSGAAASVLLDRLIALLALLPLLALGVLRLQGRFHDRAFWTTVVLLAGGVVAVSAVIASTHRLPLRWLKGHWYALRTINTSASRFLADARLALPVMCLSVVIHLITGVAVRLLADGLRIEVSLYDCLALMPMILLVTAVPVSIAGWGLREGAMVVVFGAVAVPRADALALSVALGLTLVLVALPGGLVWMVNAGGAGRHPA